MFFLVPCLGDFFPHVLSLSPSKISWKNDVNTIITTHHEKALRKAAQDNSKMCWLNVNMSGLQCKPHPVLQGVATTYEVKQMRCQVKMLCGDLYTYSVKASQTGGSPHCRLCLHPYEDLPHVIFFGKTQDQRERCTQELKTILVNADNDQICTKSLTETQFTELVENEDLFTQFIVDPTSFNLPEMYWISLQDDNISQFFSIARRMCYSSNKVRMKKLRDLK